MPVWEAQYVIVIASKTGWTEDHIRHHIPLSRGWAYYHAARIMEGERMRWPGKKSAMSSYIDKVKSWVSNLTR